MKAKPILLAVGLLTAGLTAESQAQFKQVLRLEGIVFNVECANQGWGANNMIWIVPTGLSRDERAIKESIRGIVTGADVEDINSDGSPEIYVFTRNRVTNRAGLVAYAANNRKSLSRVSLPELSASDGYRGDDQIKISGNRVVRSFPISNGKTRSISYRLTAGGNGWNLSQDRVSDSGGSYANNYYNNDENGDDSDTGMSSTDAKALGEALANIVRRARGEDVDSDVPEINVRPSGELEVMMPDGAVLLYNRYGTLIQKGSTATAEDVRRANLAVKSFRAEQGL